MGRHWRPPRRPTREEERARRVACDALTRIGYDPEEANPEYPEIGWNWGVLPIVDALLLQRDDPLPRARAAPISVAELRERARSRAWRAALDRPHPSFEPSDDDIPF